MLYLNGLTHLFGNWRIVYIHTW